VVYMVDHSRYATVSRGDGLNDMREARVGRERFLTLNGLQQWGNVSSNSHQRVS
jgi:hypothetical protein